MFFREDKKQIEGLKKTWDKTKVDKDVFTLVDDYQMKKSSRWSPESTKKIFDTYVIDPQGKVKGIMKGSLKVRPTSEKVFAYIKEVVEKKSDTDGAKNK